MKSIDWCLGDCSSFSLEEFGENLFAPTGAHPGLMMVNTGHKLNIPLLQLYYATLFCFLGSVLETSLPLTNTKSQQQRFVPVDSFLFVVEQAELVAQSRQNLIFTLRERFLNSLITETWTAPCSVLKVPMDSQVTRHQCAHGRHYIAPPAGSIQQNQYGLILQISR